MTQKIIQIPTIAYPDGVGWRLRVRGQGSPHPYPLPEGEGVSPVPCNLSPVPYVELHCHSCYSFREGASTPRELASRAAALGYEALAITDRDGLYGAMEFAKAAEAAGVRPIIGADVTLQGGYRLVLLAETREGYANLCQLLTGARLGVGCQGSGVGVSSPWPPAPDPCLDPQIPLAVLAQHTRGLIALSGDEHGEVPALAAAGRLERAMAAARRYATWFGPESFFIELQQTLSFGDTQRNRRLVELARQLGLGVVATNDVWYHVRQRHRLHDVLVAIRHRTTLDGSHRFRHANSERYLKSAEEMAELFCHCSENDAPAHHQFSSSVVSLESDMNDSEEQSDEESISSGRGSLRRAQGRRFAEFTLERRRGQVTGYRLQGSPHPVPCPLSPVPYPEALRNTIAVAERCRFDLVRDLGYEFPHAAVPPGETPDGHLARICWEALGRKYPKARGIRREARETSADPSRLTPHASCLRPQAIARLEEELALIQKHGLAGFFLAYHDLLQLAGQIAHEKKGRDPHLPPDERPVGRGRGSSVSSIVCYLIGLSHIDPIANELFLGRFLNDELPSVPDIDLDFPRDLRDELLRRIWTEFDQGRAALVCAYSTYHGRSAVRDVGKALGLPALEIDHLAKLVDSWGSSSIAKEMERLPQYREKMNAPLWRDLVALCQEIMGLPRHVTQHVGGVVLSARPLQELVPLEPTRMEGRVMCQWDKDSVDDARMVKIDFLSLGMLSLVDECLEMIERRHGVRPDLGRIPHDDPEVYERICAGDTIGLFQIESRAQITTLAHTQPRNLDDLAVQVAIVRPGPIVSGAFRPYMEHRRRLQVTGDRLQVGDPPVPCPLSPVTYIHPCLEPVLRDTLGVVLYQEQVVQVAMAIAGYTAGEADTLRRNLNRRRGAELAGEDWPFFLERARARGIPDEATQAAFRTILGFAAYGFPKSHAVAFGLLAYESAWLRYHYPAEYYAALINNQPMGFYAPEVIAGDARRHGLEIARPDVNLSAAGCVAETDGRIRLGLAEVKGIGRDRLGRSPMAEAIVAERQASGPFRSLEDFADRTGLKPEALENLILAGALDGGDRLQVTGYRGALEGGDRLQVTGYRGALDGGDRLQVTGYRGALTLSPVPCPLPPTRRELLWELGLIRGNRQQAIGNRGYRQRALGLPVEQDMVALPAMSPWEEVAAEYEVLGLSPQGHAMEQLRPAIQAAEAGGGSALSTQHSALVNELPDGAKVHMVGLVVCRQRPSTAKGVVFLSLEDEFGLANVVVYPSLFDRQRALILTEPFLTVHGRVQRQGSVVHIVAERFERPDVHIDRLIRVSHDFR